MTRDLRPWKLLGSREIFVVPRRLSVSAHAVELPGGRRYEPYYRVDLPDQAWVAATAEDGRFICQRQYKHGPERISLTLPGGIVDPGEEPLAAARRELLEETGYECRDWRPLGAFCRNNNQRCGEEHFFLASGGVWKREPDPTTNLEEIETVLMTRDELARAAADGEVPVLGHLAGILMALRRPAPETGKP